jgi:acetyl esterase
MNPAGIPEEIAAQLRRRGAVIDVAGTKALYEPLLARQPRDGVRVVGNVAYGEDARHRLDAYIPEAKTIGVLVFFHGGGFLRGDKGERANVGYAFARAGYLVLMPNYRLAPAHRWPAGPEDVATVLRWVAAHAREFGADPAHVVLAGESAGAAHVAASRLVRRFADTAPAPAGVVLLSGPYNARLEALARAQFGIATPDPRNEAYFGPDVAAWDAMSTVDLVDVAPFPLLISYAELDPPQMQVQAGELFARLVSRHGFQPGLQVVRGHDHLSQLYSIGTEDGSLFAPLRAWTAQAISQRGAPATH